MKKAQFALALAVLLTGMAGAQEKTEKAAPERTTVDFALSGAGVFSKTVSASSGAVSDAPTKAGQVFGSVRYHINSLSAIEVSIGHFRNSQIFTVPPDTYRVVTDAFEYSAAYVLTPFSGKKIQPFLLAGVGALRFSPGATYIDMVQGSFGTRSQTSLAVLYGGGLDYKVLGPLALRLQYRGLFYKNPDFSAPTRFYTGGRGHLAEPAIGLVMRF